MFDISENGKDAMVSYFKKAIGNRKVNSSGQQNNKNEMNRAMRKNKNLILAQSLIVKF